MDPDRLTRAHREPPDDAALGAIVRDVVDDWRMPPQRLDELTWRDRVGRSRGRSNGGGSDLRWTRRLLGAAAVAVVATVSLSLAAVWMTAPRDDEGTVGSSPSAGSSSTPVPSGSAAAATSPMPKLLRNGDLPTPSRIMVQTGQGYELADLATGELGPVLIPKGHGPTTLLARPGGGWVCICGEGVNVIRLALQTIDSNGDVGAPLPIRDIVGTLDPRASDAMQPQSAGVSVTASPDGRFALVGWVHRAGAAGWQLGADVIDLESLATVASTELVLDEPVVVDGQPRLRLAPLVRLSPAGDQILLASQSFVDNPSLADPNAGVDHWLAPFDGRSIGALVDAGATSGDVCIEFGSGFIAGDPLAGDAVYYATCWSPAGPLLVKRIAADGRLVSATEFPGRLGGVDRGILVPPSGEAVFSWNPLNRSSRDSTSEPAS